jgi:hypothetical protein
MINSVRTAVLSLVNKHNNGYVSPEDFNSFAKQAQLEIFEDLFIKYTLWRTKANNRLSGSEYSDIAKGIEEDIEVFSLSSILGSIGSGLYVQPADCYFVESVVLGGIIADKVSSGKMIALKSSNLTIPSADCPAYTLRGSTIVAYPVGATCSLNYIRYPKDPVWTYSSISSGEPVFNQLSSSYQDFELGLSFEPELIKRISLFLGISIREVEVYNAMQVEEVKDSQPKT